ncbi:MAG: hypothetical protein K2O67_03660, partial [Clostridia bacterium]|nr:hypothetical protein [Clostridia bacterium]
MLRNTTSAIDPNNHSFTNYIYNNDAACMLDGTETATCGYGCGATDTRTKTGTMLNHDFTNAPWETGTSNHWHECTRSGCTATDTPAPHTFNWVIDTAATVTSTGVKHEECTVCGYAQSQNTVIPILSCAHNNTTHYPAVAATCMQQGNVEYWYCSDCLKNVDQAGQELTTVVTQIDPANHSFTAYTSDNNATCTADGTKTAQCDHGCGAEDTVEDTGTALGHTAGAAANCTTAQTCTVCGAELVAALGHDWATAWSNDTTNHWHECTVCGEKNDETGHTYEWVITKEATVDESGLMENLCTACNDKDGEEEIAKLVDPNGEIDLPVDINVEFKVTQSSTDNDYSDIDKGLKRGYWAQLWYRNEDGTLGDEFMDKINCFLTLKIPTDIIEAIRGGEEINRDKIAAGLKVYYIDGEGTPVEVNNFTIAMRDDDSWQIKFNYNEKFRAEVVFAADIEEQPAEPENSGIPWWVWLIVGLVVVAIVGVIIVIIVVAKKKNDGNNGGDTEELKAQLAEQGEKIDELLGRDDGGFNTPV